MMRQLMRMINASILVIAAVADIIVRANLTAPTISAALVTEQFLMLARTGAPKPIEESCRQK